MKPWEQPKPEDEWGIKLKEIGIDELVPEKVYSKFDELKKAIPPKDERLNDPRVQKFLEMIDANLPETEYTKYLDTTDYVKIASENPKQLYEKQLIKDGINGEDFETQMQIFEELTPYDQRQRVLSFAHQLTNERDTFQQQIRNHREQVVKQYEETTAKNLSSIDSILDQSVGHKLNDNVDYVITKEKAEYLKQIMRNPLNVNPDGSINFYKTVELNMKAALFDEILDTATKTVAYNTRKKDFDNAHQVTSSTTFNTPPPVDKEANAKKDAEEARRRTFGNR